ncbi:HTH lysR-type domain-containing protein [Vibrio crassostreae]|nr:HTH lysR-type domain-containing protein [Vibrio crassostreae]CAK2317308.1 HTH lysR-type domain-containing protein [Vibrio crassostreae]CAK2485431.1 HTH lysR-type domain-containing protein [Vibrio crassostreae]CAK2849740.1 HTH lysR-type domain-containing protein [Vibrio crassostreae]
MNFSIEQLLSFVTVYEERSFSKAAARLNKHRTTTGQVINNLEDVLAVELFERIGRTVEPTEDGKLLYHYAKSAIEQSRIFDNIALSLSYGGLESINFAYPSMTPHRLLSSIRAQLDQDFPNMKVNFLVRSKSQIEQGLASGDIHFGLVMIDKGKGMYSKDSTFIGHIEFLPFVKKGGKLSQLSPTEALTALRTTRQFVLSAFKDEGMKDKLLVSAIHEEVDQLALVIKLVQDELGWAWLPKVLSESPYVTKSLEALEVDQLKIGMKFSFALWNPHSKQIMVIKKSIITATDAYIEHFMSLQNPSK